MLNEAAAMAETMESLIRESGGGTSFVQLERCIGEPALGNMELSIDRNVVIWAGVSPAFCEAVNIMKAGQRVSMRPSVPLVYFADGKVLTYQLARRVPRGGYKAPRWVPTVWWPTPASNSGRARDEAAG